MKTSIHRFTDLPAVPANHLPAAPRASHYGVQKKVEDDKHTVKMATCLKAEPFSNQQATVTDPFTH